MGCLTLPPSYANGFAPRDFAPRYPQLWKECVFAANPGLGCTGASLRDWSGYANHGELTDMTLASAWNVPQVNGLTFDGTNDYVRVGNISRLGFAGAASEISVSVWFNLPAASSFSVITKQTGSAVSSGWGFFVTNGTEFYFNTRITPGVGTGFTATLAALTGLHHAYVSWSAIKQTCFFALDGTQKTTINGLITSWTITGNTIPVRIGAYEGGVGNGDGTTTGFAAGSVIDLSVGNKYSEDAAKWLYSIGPGGMYEPADRAWISVPASVGGLLLRRRREIAL